MASQFEAVGLPAGGYSCALATTRLLAHLDKQYLCFFALFCHPMQLPLRTVCAFFCDRPCGLRRGQSASAVAPIGNVGGEVLLQGTDEQALPASTADQTKVRFSILSTQSQTGGCRPNWSLGLWRWRLSASPVRSQRQLH